MSIVLKKLSAEDGIDIYEMLQEIPKDENGFLNAVCGKTFEEYKQWLADNEAFSNATNLEDGWKVPTSTYWLYIDNRPVGMGRIRHFLTDKLREEGGHTGYAIRPSARHNGYATILLRELRTEAKKLGIDKMLLTIQNENLYSLKVAIANHGVMERKNEIRSFVWIDC
ncbi:MAG: GNAT family N-acetyltransferase [Oscillospiraceae bacterium]|nr:GNAT family N-acetyltransferase [Oscillospiraceae bacterium]